jgi:hypothetical protein
MAASNPETIKIVREKDGGATIYQLYIDGSPRARLTHTEKGGVSLEIQFAGDFSWSESRVQIMGLVKLAEVGDRLVSDTTDVKQLLHTPTTEEIEMATKAKNVKAKKKASKERKVSGEKRETAAAMFCDLIMAGSLSDDKIFAKVKEKFGLDDKKRSYVAWYRNKLKKDGQKPPEARE